MDSPTPGSAVQPPGTQASPSAPPAQPAPERLETYLAALRLLAGLALIGVEGLAERLRQWEAGHPPAPAGPATAAEQQPAGGAARALAGLVFEATGTTARAVSATANMAQSAVGAVLRPVARSPLLRPLRAPVDALASRSQERYQRFMRRGQIEEQRSRRMAEDVTGLLLEDLVDFAGENPGVKRLVDAQVDRLLPSLVTDPTIQALLVQQLGEWLEGLTTRSETLDPLVQGLGDRYIAYLNEHPDDVQNLVQGQAVSMAGEVRDSVRTITVTGDSFLEALARGLLRRTPREDLPPPGLASRYSRSPATTGTQTTESAA